MTPPIRGGFRSSRVFRASLPEKASGRVGFFQVKGDRDRPQGNQEFAKSLDSLGITNQFILLENTDHNLGLYYQRSAEAMMQFLGRQLR